MLSPLPTITSHRSHEVEDLFKHRNDCENYKVYVRRVSQFCREKTHTFLSYLVDSIKKG